MWTKNYEMWVKRSSLKGFPLVRKTRVSKKDLCVLAALVFTFNTLDHLTDHILLFRFWLLMRTSLSFHLAEGQGWNVPPNKDSLSTTKMLWVERSCVFRTTYIQLMDEVKSSKIYCKHIWDVILLWPFFSLCWSSTIKEGLPKMRNNNLLW